MEKAEIVIEGFTLVQNLNGQVQLHVRENQKGTALLLIPVDSLPESLRGYFQNARIRATIEWNPETKLDPHNHDAKLT